VHYLRKIDVKMSEIEFDPEVYLIEEEILNLLYSTPMFVGRDPTFLKILGLFMTRKYLTQRTLQKITGLSAGKISEEVNLFLEMGLIEKADVSKKGKIIYSANSAGLILLKFSKSIISIMVKWEQELDQMKEDLENNKRSLENEVGFDRIIELIDYFSDAVKKYKKSFEAMDLKDN
jgi:DNA-binding transcriptional regulator GbsR (MarR family)